MYIVYIRKAPQFSAYEPGKQKGPKVFQNCHEIKESVRGVPVHAQLPLNRQWDPHRHTQTISFNFTKKEDACLPSGWKVVIQIFRCCHTKHQ